MDPQKKVVKRYKKIGSEFVSTKAVIRETGSLRWQGAVKQASFS